MAEKNIIHITTSLSIGGLETFLLELLRNSDRKRYKPHVCTMTPNGQLIKEFEALNIPVTVLPQRHGIDYTMPIRMSSLFRRCNIDLVHTHNVHPWFYGFIASKIARVRHIIHTEHSNVSPEQTKLFYIEKYLSLGTDMIIADSSAVSKYLVEEQGIQQKKVVTIYNGIDESLYQNQYDRATMRAKLGIRHDEMVIGTVSRLVPVKNHVGLLRSFAAVKRHFNNVRLLIVGDGELRENLESLVKSLQITDSVQFLGFRRDVQSLLKAFDVFVLPSFSEGMPISLLEAMASRLPVVVSDVGGNREVIGSDECGMLVEPNSNEDLTKALIYLLTHPAQSKEKALRAELRIKNLFSISRTVCSYEGLYNKLLSDSKAG